MNTTQILTYAQIILSVLLIVTILLQQRGTGLSSTFGGGSLEYSTKRGAEKIIFWSTIVFAILFIVVSIARVFFA
jgi:protein translocase SecG subunit